MNHIFGQVYAPAYDLLYRDKDYDGEVDLLQQLFCKYAARPVQSILDLGCGTGNHAFSLAAKGYRVVGIDRSAEMLGEAYRKLEKCNADFRFHQADIRDVDLGQTFDAVIMMFAVLSYQFEDLDVLASLRTARRHLNAGGLCIFDVWYGPAVLAQGTEERVRTIEDGTSLWARSAVGKLDPHRHHCHVDFHLRHLQDGRVIEETTERHTVRYFFRPEIDRFLHDTGFQLRHLTAFPSIDREPDHKTWNVLATTVAE